MSVELGSVAITIAVLNVGILWCFWLATSNWVIWSMLSYTDPTERFSPVICYMRCVGNKQFKRFIVKILTIILLLD
jgi:hypothetical protein